MLAWKAFGPVPPDGQGLGCETESSAGSWNARRPNNFGNALILWTIGAGHPCANGCHFAMVAKPHGCGYGIENIMSQTFPRDRKHAKVKA